MLENERRATISSEILADVVDREVTDEAVENAYEESYANAEPETEYKAAHILVETEAEAADLVADLEGGADFAALAQEHSTGPSGTSGGDLGWFAAGTMVEAFQEAVDALEPGQISGPVQTQFGWHVIRLDETRAKERPALQEVRGEIVQQLRDAAIEAHVAKLSDPADIDRVEPSEIDPAVIGRTGLLDD